MADVAAARTSVGRGRRDPRERLRSGFVSQAVHQVHDWLALLDGLDGDDARESVSHELDRLAETAGSLGLDEIRDAAREAAGGVADGGGAGVLDGLVGVLRTRGIERLFREIAVVGDEPSLAALAGGSERIHPAASIEALERDVRLDELQAALVPATPRATVRRLAEALPGRIYAWATDDDAALHALEDGVVACFRAPLDREGVLWRIRADTEARGSSGGRALLVGRAPDPLEGLYRTLGALEAGAVADLHAVLDGVGADLVVLLGDLADASVGQAAGLVRSHARGARLPLVRVGRSGDPWENAVDELIPLDAHTEERLVARLRRGHPDVDPLTGLPGRAATLAALDAELSRARRGRPLTVALVDVDGTQALNARAGRQAGDAALRQVARALREGVRAHDLVGRLGGDAFLVALSGCTAPVAARRFQQVQERLAARHTGLSFSAGIADTSLGIDDVAHRADHALLEVRGRATAAGIGVFH